MHSIAMETKSSLSNIAKEKLDSEHQSNRTENDKYLPFVDCITQYSFNDPAFWNSVQELSMQEKSLYAYENCIIWLMTRDIDYTRGQVNVGTLYMALIQ